MPRPRRSIPAALMSLTLAALAVGGLGAAPAHASDPDYVTLKEVAWEGVAPARTLLRGVVPVPVPEYTCPVDRPWLSSAVRDDAYVLRGISVDGGPAIDATILGPQTFDPVFGRVTGWSGDPDGRYNHVVNRGYAPVSATLFAHCTNDPALAYTAKPVSKPVLQKPFQIDFREGRGEFTIRATGFPAPTFRIIQGGVFEGQTFTDNGDGTATISGRAQGTSRTASIYLEAKNAYGVSQERFTLNWT